MADYTILKNELDTDPLVRGYAGMDDATAAADLNTVYRTKDRTSMTGDEIYQATDPAEFNALDNGSGNTSDVQHRWITFTRSQDIDPFANANVQLVISIFGNPSTTVTNLNNLRSPPASRAEELNLGTVTPGDVKSARAI